MEEFLEELDKPAEAYRGTDLSQNLVSRHLIFRQLTCMTSGEG
jgi:hypothetical protein